MKKSELILKIESLTAELARVTEEKDKVLELLSKWEKFETFIALHGFIPPETWCGTGKEGQ